MSTPKPPGVWRAGRQSDCHQSSAEVQTDSSCKHCVAASGWVMVVRLVVGACGCVMVVRLVVGVSVFWGDLAQVEGRKRR